MALRTITVIVGLLVASTSRAEPSEAERLYEEGKQLASAGEYVKACERFEESFALDHDAGIEVRLADCHQALGHLTKAWHLFDDAARRWQRARDDRVSFARKRLGELEAKLAMVEIGVAEPDLEGLEVTINGERVDAASTVREVVKPGRVEIVATAPNRARFARSRVVPAGDTFGVEVRLGPPQTERRRSRVYAAGGLAATSGLSFAISIAFVLDARAAYKAAVNDPAHCDPGSPPHCDATGQAEIDSAQSRANVGTGFAIASGAFAVTAAIVYYTAPRDIVVAPTASANGGGLTIAGHF